MLIPAQFGKSRGTSQFQQESINFGICATSETENRAHTNVIKRHLKAATKPNRQRQRDQRHPEVNRKATQGHSQSENHPDVAAEWPVPDQTERGDR